MSSTLDSIRTAHKHEAVASKGLLVMASGCVFSVIAALLQTFGASETAFNIVGGGGLGLAGLGLVQLIVFSLLADREMNKCGCTAHPKAHRRH